MNGLKCLSCAFIPYPKHLYSAGAIGGSGYLSLPIFPIYNNKGISVFLEVVSPWHTMLYKTIDVPFIHFTVVMHFVK